MHDARPAFGLNPSSPYWLRQTGLLTRRNQQPSHKAQCQVVDLNGEVIAGLYCGGESAGGFGMHGLPRCTTQAFIAGRLAAAEQVRA